VILLRICECHGSEDRGRAVVSSGRTIGSGRRCLPLLPLYCPSFNYIGKFGQWSPGVFRIKLGGQAASQWHEFRVAEGCSHVTGRVGAGGVSWPRPVCRALHRLR
jgi:hypothetical protein